MAPDTTHTTPIYLGRQPILDARQSLYGYELLFRSGPAPNRAIVANHMVATATVITHAFTELGLADALGEQKAFINVDGDFLLSEAVELLPKDKVVLEILETVEVTPELLKRCRELKAKGFTLALDDIVAVTPAMEPLLDLMDIAKVCISAVSEEALPGLVQALARRPLELLAEQVESREQMEHCRNLGFHLFQGYYFAHPTILSGRKLGQSRLSLLKLLSQVLDDSDTPQLEQTFKHEPGLSINLLRMANSAAVGARTRITSLRHAITLLGRRQLQRWLQLLIYANQFNAGSQPNPLMPQAALRGRLVELIALAAHPEAAEDTDFHDCAYMAGAFSLLDVLLHLPMDSVLAALPLADEVAEAVGRHQGPLGDALSLVESLERGLPAPDTALLEKLRLRGDALGQLQVDALAWVSHIDVA